MVTLTLTEEQERRLQFHAAMRNCSPEQAFDALLSTEPPARRPWTEQDLALLRNPKNSPRDLARRLNRTVSAVSVRRNQLAKDENLPELQRPRQPEQLRKPRAVPPGFEDFS